MPKAILGKKIGMTQIFDEAGRAVPVTVIEAGPCVVVQKRTVEKDGYDGRAAGFRRAEGAAGQQAALGTFPGGRGEADPVLARGAGADGEAFADLEVGGEIKADVFEAGEYVDVTGVSKGKGFAGTVKRHNFAADPCPTVPGTIGGVGSLGRVGTGSGCSPAASMPGRMGGVAAHRFKVLKVVRVDADRNLILVRGSVPGPRGGLVLVKETVKHKS